MHIEERFWGLIAGSAAAAVLSASPVLATAVEAPVAVAAYDRDLCATAQRILINAEGRDVAIVVERAAAGGGFGTLQMDTRADPAQIVVAMLTEQVAVDGGTLDASVWCKLVDQERVNDVLGTTLPPPRRSCRDVNEHTYRRSLAMLPPEQRTAYEASGKPLRFVQDWNAEAGAAWLPSVVNDHVSAVEANGDEPAHLRVQAPSVQVAWDPAGADWYKGTHHCKLITLAAMQRWMKRGALAGDSELFPRANPACTAPSRSTARVGSCLQYFGPADATFCADYSGSGWTETTARKECAQRHATKAAWLGKQRAYGGDGGIFSAESCAERGATAEVRREPFNLADSGDYGTCVFRCNQGDESLWHSITAVPETNQGRGGMQRACDLFIPPATSDLAGN
jgi:hypothetical protein